VGDSLLGLRGDVREVEHDPAQVRPAFEQRLQKRAVTSSDVDDGLASAPPVCGERVGQHLLPSGHEAVEARALVGMSGQVVVPRRPEDGVEGRLARLDELQRPAEGGVELLAEHEREVSLRAGNVA
jgi:hypothetical protein